MTTREVAQQLNMVLQHCLRNAVAHPPRYDFLYVVDLMVMKASSTSLATNHTLWCVRICTYTRFLRDGRCLLLDLVIWKLAQLLASLGQEAILSISNYFVAIAENYITYQLSCCPCLFRTICSLRAAWLQVQRVSLCSSHLAAATTS